MSLACGGLFGNKRTLQRKIVVIGDGACGKTSLLTVFTRGYFPEVTRFTGLRSMFAWTFPVALGHKVYSHSSANLKLTITR
jgi:GTPase SAR1 family protein